MTVKELCALEGVVYAILTGADGTAQASSIQH